MNRITWGILLLFVIGCKNFETKKVSSEEIVKEELKQIDWKDVENYPTFLACEKCADKKSQQECFESKFSTYIYESLLNHQVFLTDSINEKVLLYVSISSKGEPYIDSLHISENIQKQLPQFKSWLDSSVANLPEIYPARKRGIPVATSFKLPLVIESE